MTTLVEGDDDISFHMGELFDSYEDLEYKLDTYSQRNFVHFWRRDSRTVNGAHMKTARPICEKLKYYSVKYACIYGGQKFLPRGAGRRQSQSIRTNCPAHIMLRASKDGTKLEVTGVNNEHNHEISEELFKKLPQERKLCGALKEEVQDLMQLHIDRKRLKEYVRLRANKILRSKDLFNIAAANKQKRKIPEARAYELYRRMDEVEQREEDRLKKRKCSESEDDVAEKIKKMKKDHDVSSPWGQDGFEGEMEVGDSNNDEECYIDLQEVEEEGEETIDESTTEEQLLGSNEITDTDSEIVGEMVMDPSSDPSVVIDSVVQVDASSLYVDEPDFNSFNHLGHSVDDSDSPQALDIGMMNPVDIDEISKTSVTSPSPSPQICDPLENDKSVSKIWVIPNPSNNDNETDNNNTDVDNIKQQDDNNINNANGEIGDVVFSDEASHQLFAEQLSVLRAEKVKLHHETDMLKLKKDKLKLQMDCYTGEIEKQKMEKEKLRLQIELLRSKFIVNNTDNTPHYHNVP
ncbi:hypothetical protein HCN44_005510 [Aphidius gifuensis]|uniref:ZSWIM3 N-terminal domain-containing protein n=1 Tax=Aphidius gifuensis TaxID=684658 RepID=A0A835CX86_APHGI|nr:rho GTPase-activating protein gacV-like [Aphidius gifuensis]XP_044010162.1 rho GTPase-activating protein gacV-like [Aphidius gifuensis]KAF7997233.1 hypothetical protein HCN44_005510 [Aphidius gifuensis]